MHGISVEEITFYGMVWAVAFAASVCRAIRDGDAGTLWHGSALGVTSGFVSFGIVSVWRGSNAGGDALPWYWLGVSAFIGLAGKEQDNILRLAIRALLKGFRQAIDEQDQPDKKD